MSHGLEWFVCCASWVIYFWGDFNLWDMWMGKGFDAWDLEASDSSLSKPKTGISPQFLFPSQERWETEKSSALLRLKPKRKHGVCMETIFWKLCYDRDQYNILMKGITTRWILTNFLARIQSIVSPNCHPQRETNILILALRLGISYFSKNESNLL